MSDNSSEHRETAQAGQAATSGALPETAVPAVITRPGGSGHLRTFFIWLLILAGVLAVLYFAVIPRLTEQASRTAYERLLTEQAQAAGQQAPDLAPGQQLDADPQNPLSEQEARVQVAIHNRVDTTLKQVEAHLRDHYTLLLAIAGIAMTLVLALFSFLQAAREDKADRHLRYMLGEIRNVRQAAGKEHEEARRNQQSTGKELESIKRELEAARVELEKAGEDLDGTGANLINVRKELESARIALNNVRREEDNARERLELARHEHEQAREELARFSQEFGGHEQQVRQLLENLLRELGEREKLLVEKHQRLNSELSESEKQTRLAMGDMLGARKDLEALVKQAGEINRQYQSAASEAADRIRPVDGDRPEGLAIPVSPGSTDSPDETRQAVASAIFKKPEATHVARVSIEPAPVPAAQAEASFIQPPSAPVAQAEGSFIPQPSVSARPAHVASHAPNDPNAPNAPHDLRVPHDLNERTGPAPSGQGNISSAQVTIPMVQIEPAFISHDPGLYGPQTPLAQAEPMRNELPGLSGDIPAGSVGAGDVAHGGRFASEVLAEPQSLIDLGLNDSSLHSSNQHNSSLINSENTAGSEIFTSAPQDAIFDEPALEPIADLDLDTVLEYGPQDPSAAQASVLHAAEPEFDPAEPEFDPEEIFRRTALQDIQQEYILEPDQEFGLEPDPQPGGMGFGAAPPIPYEAIIEEYRNIGLGHLENLIDAGDSMAITEMGHRFYLGIGVPRDYNRAVEFSQRAADMDNAIAQVNLGFMYMQGIGVPRDYNRAFELYSRAADQGYPLGMLNLGLLYVRGHGTGQSFARAFEMFNASAEHGNILGMLNLGVMYEHGDGIPQDYAKAFEMYERAADLGNAKAQAYLAELYEKGHGAPRDPALASRWLVQAADNGYVEAMLKVAKRYLSGIGLPPDSLAAYTYLLLYKSFMPQEDSKVSALMSKFGEILAPQQIFEAQSRAAKLWKKINDI